MNLHARMRIIDMARLEFDRLLLDLAQKHELTYGELFLILGSAVSDNAKCLIRAERHPDEPGKKGDEA